MAKARADLGVRADGGARVTEPGVARIGGRAVAVSLLSESQSRLPAPAPDDTAAPAAAPVRVDRPTPVAWTLVAVAALALFSEWWTWARGPGAPSLSPARPLRRR